MSRKCGWAVLALVLAPTIVPVAADTLDTAFQNPPREAGVRCWWWWLNSNVTKEARKVKKLDRRAITNLHQTTWPNSDS